jgi:hypothetical protein
MSDIAVTRHSLSPCSYPSPQSPECSQECRRSICSFLGQYQCCSFFSAKDRSLQYRSTNEDKASCSHVSRSPGLWLHARLCLFEISTWLGADARMSGKMIEDLRARCLRRPERWIEREMICRHLHNTVSIASVMRIILHVVAVTHLSRPPP